MPQLSLRGKASDLCFDARKALSANAVVAARGEVAPGASPQDASGEVPGDWMRRDQNGQWTRRTA